MGDISNFIDNIANPITIVSFVFALYGVSDKKLSLHYANEAAEILGRCNDTPLVRALRENSKQVIERWNDT
jgi:hypothetical protein